MVQEVMDGYIHDDACKGSTRVSSPAPPCRAGTLSGVRSPTRPRMGRSARSRPERPPDYRTRASEGCRQVRRAEPAHSAPLQYDCLLADAGATQASGWRWAWPKEELSQVQGICPSSGLHSET